MTEAEQSREAAARVCEDLYSRCAMGDPWREASRMCAAAIRALPASPVEGAVAYLRAQVTARRAAWHADDFKAYRDANEEIDCGMRRVVVEIDRELAAAEAAERGEGKK